MTVGMREKFFRLRELNTDLGEKGMASSVERRVSQSI